MAGSSSMMRILRGTRKVGYGERVVNQQSWVNAPKGFGGMNCQRFYRQFTRAILAQLGKLLIRCLELRFVPSCRYVKCNFIYAKHHHG